MSKLLITHHGYQNSTGWSRVGQDIILCLDKAGVDIVPIPILLNEQSSNINPRILELENKSQEGTDIILNVVLPHHLEYNSNFKNISYFFSETDNLPREWADKLELMDLILVPNASMILACRKAGITKRIEVVKPPIDVTKYERTYSELPELKSKLAGDFSFLWVGDLNRRKNLSAVLKAWHTEFTTNEPCSLVIKPYKFNTSPQEQENLVRKMSEEIRRGLKLYPNLNDYKQEIVISEQLSDEDILRLHSTCDCLVSCPYGEALGLPIIDSLGLGKVTIGHKVGGPKDYLCGLNEYDETENYWEEHSNSLTITEYEGCKEIVFGMNEGFPYLFTGRENWVQPSTVAIAERMCFAYNMSERDKKILAKNALSTVYEFSYDNFAKRMKELL